MPTYFDLLFTKKTGQKFTNHARNTLSGAFELARNQGSLETDLFHLFHSIYLEKGSMGSAILKDMGIRKKHLKNTASQKKVKASSAYTPLPSQNLKKILIKALSIARTLKYPYVGTEHLVYAILDFKNEKIQKIISLSQSGTHARPIGVNLSSHPVIKETGQEKLFSLFKDFSSLISDSQAMPEGLPLGINEKKAVAEKNHSYIARFCTDINKEIESNGDTFIGRENEIRRIVNILGRKNKNNPMLIGQPGVGKTALVMKMAQLINQDEVPAFLFGKKIMNLDIAALIAGTSFRGEFELRLKEIIREVSQNKDIILFIDEIHNIVGAGNISGNLDLANILKPALSKGEIRLIGATTLKEYKQHIEKDAALERRFQTILVKEPNQDESKIILRGIKKDYEKFHNVLISDETIETCVELSCRYIRDRFLPDKAIDVLDEAASHIRSRLKISDFAKKIKTLETEKKKMIEEKEKNIANEIYDKALFSKEKEEQLAEQIKFLKLKQKDLEKDHGITIEISDITETVARISGIPLEKLANAKDRRIKNISSILGSHIIGQREAVEKISNVLIRSQFGISSPDRPLGSFLFMGPSGVGKTLTARVLAREFFDTEKNLIKIDMSEFMERHSVSGLIGSPAGYVGYGEGGRLTEKVRRHPYSVILFDEIEKAHPDVFNILLQILEDGILTDAQGLEVSFKNTVVILTTNVGTEDFNRIPPAPLGFKTPQKNDSAREKIKTAKETVLRELEDRMRPELLNRLDYVLVFSRLSRKDLEKITGLEMEKIKGRLEKQGLFLDYHPSVIKFIVQKNPANEQGARFIRKNIQDIIENEIARIIVADKVKNNRVAVLIKNGKLLLS